MPIDLDPAIAELCSEFTFGDMVVSYVRDKANGALGLWLRPVGLDSKIAPRRTYLDVGPETVAERNKTMRAWRADSLVQVKFVEDAYPSGFSTGRSLRNSASVAALRLDGQDYLKDEGVVLTRFSHPNGCKFEHRLTWRQGGHYLASSVTVINAGPTSVEMEMLPSFSLGGMSPYQKADQSIDLVLHRYRSYWSMEGKPESTSLAELHLERSWSGQVVKTERFGQIGSMPVRGHFPIALLEDRSAGVTWGAQLAWAGSWQMEVYRKDDLVNLSGGLADAEFGHWRKTLAPGQRFETPRATLTTCIGDRDAACERMLEAQADAIEGKLPASEAGMPLIYNDWCTYWGDVTLERLRTLTKRLRGTGVRYFVIDDGWFGFNQPHGDWRVDLQRLPGGLRAAADIIRAEGMIPGLWFELETCHRLSDAGKEASHLLHLGGRLITVQDRRFWDLNDPWVQDYLEEKVIGQLDEAGFGYIKVDYNETMPYGADGAESPGEGLRRNVEGTYRFFRRMRERLPHLVIENCASGGHRLEPSMQALASMASFSDAHETVDIPVVGASLHNLILPKQSQIWAVLRAHEDRRRMQYSLAAGFLGRLCLSGDIDELDAEQWAFVEEALRLYPHFASIIANGSSRLFGESERRFGRPNGWQALRRLADDEAMVVAHVFSPSVFEVTLPGGPWTMARAWNDKDWKVGLSGGVLRIEAPAPMSAGVFHLKR